MMSSSFDFREPFRGAGTGTEGALFELAADMPAPILAELLGTTEKTPPTGKARCTRLDRLLADRAR